MNLGEKGFNFDVIQKQPGQNLAIVTIPHEYVDLLYNEALQAQKTEADTFGFSKGKVPLQYIETTFRPHLIDHLKRYFLNHCVVNYLYKSLRDNKITLAGDPSIFDISLEPKKNAQFVFKLTQVKTESDERWKKIGLQAPSRKNYKDIDRQVESFLIEDAVDIPDSKKSHVNLKDWVAFEMVSLDHKDKPLFGKYKNNLWVRINDEEVDRELREAFLGKKIGEPFINKSNFCQEYVNNGLEACYGFQIHIKDLVSHDHFSVELFKRHFGLKNTKDVHQKLIEVFSFRNDISQRRETVEAVLRLLLKQYFITMPAAIFERQKQAVLSKVHNNPDYLVYKAKHDFEEKVKMLAEKQLKETIIIDTIAYQEGIEIDGQDILSYLNLIQRPRTKEFVYFEIPATKISGMEIPVPVEMLKQYCLREKTLNHVIHYLTNK